MRDAKARAKKKIAGLIVGRAKELGIPIRELWTMARIGKGTYYNRMKNPETFTLGEIWRLEDVLHLERGTIGGVR